jgi:hypothetical protein
MSGNKRQDTLFTLLCVWMAFARQLRIKYDKAGIRRLYN